MIKKFFRRLSFWFLGILLIPVLWVSSKELVQLATRIGSSSSQSWLLLLIGALSYFLIEWIFNKPMTLYVFGHELTHALSGLVSGAKVLSFKAKASGGEVRLSKSNIFVALSPYIVPLYSIFLVILYAVLRVWWPGSVLNICFRFLLGVLFAFHISMTFHAIHGKQTDLKVAGFFFSLISIALGNVVILSLFCIGLFDKTPTLRTYVAHVFSGSLVLWKKGFSFISAFIFEQIRSHKWIP